MRLPIDGTDQNLETSGLQELNPVLPLEAMNQYCYLRAGDFTESNYQQMKNGN